MVHVRSQERHRHSVNVLRTFASVPTIRPLQKGQAVGRSTAMPSRRSNIMFSPGVGARCHSLRPADVGGLTSAINDAGSEARLKWSGFSPHTQPSAPWAVLPAEAATGSRPNCIVPGHREWVQGLRSPRAADISYSRLVTRLGPRAKKEDDTFRHQTIEAGRIVSFQESSDRAERRQQSADRTAGGRGTPGEARPRPAREAELAP